MEAKSSSGTPLPLVQPDWSPVATVRCDYQSTGRREDGKYVEHDTIPHLCHIEMTYACNEKCIFCYNPERTDWGGLRNACGVSLKMGSRYIQNIPRQKLPDVAFGEFLVVP